jgi:uncharacterized protein DUF6056
MKTSSPPNSLDSSTQDQYSSKLLIFILLVFPAIVLLLHSYLGSYTRLIADDFCSFYFSHRLDMLRYIWNQYLTWGGRYSAFAVDSLIDNVGVNGLHYFTVTLLVIWVCVTSFTVYQLLQVEAGTRRRQGIFSCIAIGTTAVFAILSMSPNVPQVLYWWNGMRTYLPSLIVTTFYIGFFYWAQRNWRSPNAVLWGSVASFIVALIDAGFNEPLCVVLFSFFIGYTALRVLTRTLNFHDPLFSFLSAASLGTALALVIILMSPGTVLRQVYFPQPPGLVKMLAIATNGYLGYLTGLVSAPIRVSALIALIFTSIWIGTVSDKKLSNPYWTLAPVSGGVLLSFASILPSVYGTSEMAHPRTLIIPSFIIAVSVFCAGLMSGQWLSRNGAASIAIRSGLMLCVSISIISSTWMNARALYESRDTYISFAQRWDQANVQITQAKLNGDASVTIPALNPWTGPGGDPTDNRNFWVNRCFSLYYNFPVFGPNPDTSQP